VLNTSLVLQNLLSYASYYRKQNPALFFAMVKLQVFFSSVNYEGRALIAMNLNRELIKTSGHRAMK
jgi:hypothetical protein